MLRTGSSGSDVVRLQTALTNEGFRCRGGIDGDFGAGTKAAVIAFQRANDLYADGIVGGETALKLFGGRDSKFFDGVNDSEATSRPRPGRGWAGSEGMADAAIRLARQAGISVTSTKRNYADSIRVGSSTHSDHFTGNTDAYAVDFGVYGAEGDRLARRIADAYGIPRDNIGSYDTHTISVDGKDYRLQLLWEVPGHYNHVHLGIRREW